MRRAAGLAAALLAMPAWANPAWEVLLENGAEVVAIDRASFESSAEGIRFRERRSLRGEQIDPHSQRPQREVLEKRQIDCRARRIATLSRAVFSDHDALIEHRAVRPRDAVWQPVAQDDPVFRTVCAGS